MNYNLSFSTTNVWGLSLELKRKKVFACLKQKEYDVCFLQETHSTAQQELIWQQQWGFSRSMYFSHGTNLASGVAILFKRGLDLKVERTWRDRGEDV